MQYTFEKRTLSLLCEKNSVKRFLRKWSYILAFLTFFPKQSFAAPLTVTSDNDSGPGTLREAILNANLNGDASNTINFSGDFVINFQNFLPLIIKNLVIDGLSGHANPVQINGGGTVGGIFINSELASADVTVTLQGLVIENMLTKGGNGGLGNCGGGGGGMGGVFLFIVVRRMLAK